jgi:hypothetical protein
MRMERREASCEKIARDHTRKARAPENPTFAQLEASLDTPKGLSAATVAGGRIGAATR